MTRDPILIVVLVAGAMATGVYVDRWLPRARAADPAPLRETPSSNDLIEMKRELSALSRSVQSVEDSVRASRAAERAPQPTAADRPGEATEKSPEPPLRREDSDKLRELQRRLDDSRKTGIAYADIKAIRREADGIDHPEARRFVADMIKDMNAGRLRPPSTTSSTDTH
jgi:hypothetical protein